MPGPNHGAGVKVLVHNQTDTPLIHDLGVAVPPGAHARIGMQASRVSYDFSFLYKELCSYIKVVSRYLADGVRNLYVITVGGRDGLLWPSFSDASCPVPDVYIYHLPDMINVWILFLHLSTSRGCFRPRTLFISDLHTQFRIISRAPSQYKDRLIYVWRFPC